MRLVLFLGLLLATATPEELASLAPWPRCTRCPACGVGDLRTLWQEPRPSSRALPALDAWSGGQAGADAMKEDRSSTPPCAAPAANALAQHGTLALCRPTKTSIEYRPAHTALRAGFVQGPPIR